MRTSETICSFCREFVSAYECAQILRNFEESSYNQLHLYQMVKEDSRDFKERYYHFDQSALFETYVVGFLTT